MTKFSSRIIGIIITTFMLFSIMLIPATVFAAADTSKMLVVTVGQFSSYTDSDYQALADSYVTDYVIAPALTTDYGGTEAGYKTNLVPKIIDFINKIAAKKSTAKIWIGTPGIGSTNSSVASTSLDPFYNYITYIKSQISTTVWTNNIRGVYMNCESVYGTVDYTSITSNAVIKLMNDLSYRVHTNLSKKFLWIPYYGYGTNAATIIKNIGYVADKSTIYDIVILQPHYYFDTTGESKTNLDGCYYSVNKQAICYRDGVQVIAKTSSTIIGVEMESNWKLAYPSSYPDFKQRYDEYVNKFKGFKGSYPFAFYYDGTLQTALSDWINSFYNY